MRFLCYNYAMMQSQFQPEENLTPQTAYLPAAQTSLTTETQAETQDVQAITERLNAIVTRSKNARRRFWQFYLVVIAGVAASFFGALLFLNPLDPLFLPLILGILPVEILAFILLFMNWSRSAPKFNADEIARLGGVQAIPALVAAVSTPMRLKKKQAIIAALTLLLPQMKASDAPILTPALRRTLNLWLVNAPLSGFLQRHYDPLFIAILKALEQVGDSSAIPVVSRLAKMKGQTRRQKALRQAAIECLPMLRANCGEVETARILLRASDASEVRSDTLLRAASGSGQTDSAELLRGADSPDAAE